MGIGIDIKGIANPLISLKQGSKKPHTVQYPFEEKKTADRYRGLHYNQLDECIGCGTCSTICQNEAIDMIELIDFKANLGKGDSGLRPRVDNGRCCWCALCVEVCPTSSLSLTKNYNYVSDDADAFLWTPGISNPEGKQELSFTSTKESSLMDWDRVPMKEMEGGERIKSFAEVVLGYNDEEAKKESSRCISCGICTEVCPDHMHIPEYINAIYHGNIEDSIRIIYDNNPLPEMCGKVCTRRCEDVCAIQHRGEAIAIRWLKRYATEKAKNADEIAEIVNPKTFPQNGHSVGIIGAGPSGLTAGYYLALRGFDVTIYEAQEFGGGMTMYGIPKYRLPFEDIKKQVDYMIKMGVKVNFNTRVGKDIQFDELKEKHEAVFIGVGFWKPYTLGIKGEEFENSIQAVNYLHTINAGGSFDVGKKVAVIGGGNVAIDAARVSKRYGAEVTILYRRRVQDMPADWEEIEGAEHENVIIKPQTIPLEIIPDENGKVKAIKYGNAEMVVDPVKGGRPKPKLIEGDEVTMEVDTIIGAIGQESNLDFLPEDVTNSIEIEWGKIKTDQNQQTALDWLYAGGDLVNDTADAISAIADGYRACKSIEKKLLGRNQE